MTLLAGAALLLASGGAVHAPAEPARVRIDHVQLRVRQRGVVRVPVPRDSRPERPIRWKERRGPRCIPANALAGARVNEDDESVDLLLRGGARVRAELESRCPALDYYVGFYIRPGADGQVCADRDAIHTRAGGQCEIDRFRSLVPER